MDIRLELSWQPMFGGGVRGLGYFDVLNLSMIEVFDVLEWMSKRHAAEAKSFGQALSARGRRGQ